MVHIEECPASLPVAMCARAPVTCTDMILLVRVATTKSGTMKRLRVSAASAAARRPGSTEENATDMTGPGAGGQEGCITSLERQHHIAVGCRCNVEHQCSSVIIIIAC